MARLPGLGVGLAGLAVFIVALLALVQGENIPPAETGGPPADTSGDVDGNAGDADGDTGSAGQDAEEDPENIVRVHPDKVTIQGEKWSLRSVAYSRVPLTVWVSDLSADGGTNDGGTTDEQDDVTQEPPPPDLSWSPVSAGDGSVPLTVVPSEPDEDTAGPCAGNRSLPDESDPPPCYKVGLEGSSRLPAGTYGATIYVGDAPDGRRTVPVEVLVGRPLYWLIFVVAAGVLATELVVWWRTGGAHRRGWRVRRAKWLDWLSEDLGWTRPYEGQDVERVALRTVQKSLREKVLGLREWLDRGAKGETVIGELPSTGDAAEDMIYPLRAECERFLANPGTLWRNTLDHLDECLADLGARAVSEVREDWTKAYEAMKRAHWDPKASVVQRSYKALDERWRTEPRPTDKKLSDAWSAIQTLWRRMEELSKEAPKQPVLPDDATTPADLANAANALSEHLSKLRADVFSKASESLKSLEGLDPQEPGRQQTEAFLKKVVDRTEHLAQAEHRVDRVKHPLKYAGDSGPIGETLKSLRRDLQTLDEAIGGTFSRNLTEDAVRMVILKPVREQLESTEAVFYDSSGSARERWFELRSKYNQNHHFVRLGERILENKELLGDFRNKWNLPWVGNEWQTKVRRSLEEAEWYLKRAYRYLLDGKALDGEIELERAEESLQAAYRERAKHEGWVKRIRSTITEDLGRPVGNLAHRIRHVFISATFAILIVATIVLSLVLLLLNSLAFQDENDSTASVPGWVPLDEPLARGLERARFVLEHPAWFGFLFALLLSIGLVYLQTRTPTRPAHDVGNRERLENAWPFAVRLVFGIVSGLLSLVIAVTVILAYQQTVPEEQMATWGTNLDLVIAFALGVLAHRVVKSLRSASEGLVSFLVGEEKPATVGESTEKKEDGVTGDSTSPTAKSG